MTFTTICGHFFRAIATTRLDDVLAAPSAASAGRYHRPGQSVLYMSPSAEWATIAVSGYIREDGIGRAIVPLLVSEASVVDQRDEEVCFLLGIDRDASNVSWRRALQAGKDPPSWQNADLARAAGADGIIDRSRQIPGGWHVNLFRWNELGGPTVKVIGRPVPITLSSGGSGWRA